MSLALTKRAVDGAGPLRKDHFLWDVRLSGFGVKVTPKGRKVFIYQYRSGGRGAPTKRVTLGTYGELTVDQARVLAQHWAAQVARGGDPREEIVRRKQSAATRSANTFGGLVEDFIDQYAKVHQKRWQETARIIRNGTPKGWCQRPAESLTRLEISQLLHATASRAPIAANRLMANLRKCFSWAVSVGRLETSPMSGMTMPAPERSRDRVLHDEELVRLLRASDALGYPFGPFFRLLVLTAQRRDEVAGMQWSEIKGDCWTIPASRAKNGKAHVVHLTVQAQKVLAQIPRQAGSDLVFTTTGKTAISGFSNAREALAKASGVQDWRFHDVRRTVTTGLANLGHPPHVCDKILNHVSGTISGVKAVYQKAEFLSERRQALEDWAAHIDFICQSKVPAAVLTE